MIPNSQLERSSGVCVSVSVNVPSVYVSASVVISRVLFGAKFKSFLGLKL